MAFSILLSKPNIQKHEFYTYFYHEIQSTVAISMKYQIVMCVLKNVKKLLLSEQVLRKQLIPDSTVFLILKGQLTGPRQFLAIERLSKMMKNAFYFTWKSLIFIFPNISISKGNQTIKFGQLIEYNIGNIFLEKSSARCGGETSSMTLLYKTNMRHIYASTVWTFIKLFLLYAQIEEYQIILNIRCRPIAFTWYKASLKNKKGSATSLPASFSVWFWNKKTSNVIFYEPTKLHCLIAFLLGLKITTQFAPGVQIPT